MKKQSPVALSVLTAVFGFACAHELAARPPNYDESKIVSSAWEFPGHPGLPGGAFRSGT